MTKIAIIGGTGLENPDILKNANTISVTTPYGDPSSELTTGKIEGKEVVILSRHGKDHLITPTGVNNRANIRTLKEQGCTYILATTACGSLREEIGRGHIVIPDQFIDYTRHRKVSFYDSFEKGMLKHTAMSDPFDLYLREKIIETAAEMELNYHPRGTVITIEGPRFSTRAESNMFRIWGADVINMSTAPETALANEAQIPYAAIAISTDYDCWKTDETPVTWEEVLKVFSQNVKNVIKLLVKVIGKL